MKTTLTSLAVATSRLAYPVAFATDKILFRTPIAASTALPDLGPAIAGARRHG